MEVSLFLPANQTNKVAPRNNQRQNKKETKSCTNALQDSSFPPVSRVLNEKAPISDFSGFAVVTTSTKYQLYDMRALLWEHPALSIVRTRPRLALRNIGLPLYNAHRIQFKNY